MSSWWFDGTCFTSKFRSFVCWSCSLVIYLYVFHFCNLTTSYFCKETDIRSNRHFIAPVLTFIPELIKELKCEFDRNKQVASTFNSGRFAVLIEGCMLMVSIYFLFPPQKNKSSRSLCRLTHLTWVKAKTFSWEDAPHRSSPVCPLEALTPTSVTGAYFPRGLWTRDAYYLQEDKQRACLLFLFVFLTPLAGYHDKTLSLVAKNTVVTWNTDSIRLVRQSDESSPFFGSLWKACKQQIILSSACKHFLGYCRSDWVHSVEINEQTKYRQPLVQVVCN